MATAKKEQQKIDSPTGKPVEKYFQGIGRRKRSVARVRLFEASKSKDSKNEPEILVNEMSYKNYFSLSELKEIVKSPIKLVSSEGIGKITVVVRGGGIRGQAEAIRLGIARTLVVKDENLKKTLKDLGYLTRDARKVERKKVRFEKSSSRSSIFQTVGNFQKLTLSVSI
jgi:small subunit ribosomal protein S9